MKLLRFCVVLCLFFTQIIHQSLEDVSSPQRACQQMQIFQVYSGRIADSCMHFQQNDIGSTFSRMHQSRFCGNFPRDFFSSVFFFIAVFIFVCMSLGYHTNCFMFRHPFSMGFSLGYCIEFLAIFSTFVHVFFFDFNVTSLDAVETGCITSYELPFRILTAFPIRQC